MTGTHRGELLGRTATNKKVTATEALFSRVVAGKIVEIRREADRLGLFQQLGLIVGQERAVGD
jgi:predicted ester cyclase